MALLNNHQLPLDQSLEQLRRQICRRLPNRGELFLLPDIEPPEIGAYQANVLICATGCAASGANDLLHSLKQALAEHHLAQKVGVIPTGCQGFCAMGPIVTIYPEGLVYCHVRPQDIPRIVQTTLLKHEIVESLTWLNPMTNTHVPYYRDIPFFARQMRIALRNCGMINPESIEEYIAADGYAALVKALTQMTPQQVLTEMKNSNLRGRGGAGFPVGIKWEFTRSAPGFPKYVVCNADEGDPGAFMDRSIIEGDPFSLLEGMTIAAYAIGSEEGYVYCRAEYPLAIKRLEAAIRLAEEHRFLGDHILGTGFNFHLRLKEGAGAFVCGEETALLASIEGRRGEPRPRPPFPATSGLWNKPTNLNNVKSYANVPQIILKGGEWFAGIGSKRSPGTAIFALSGKINNTGLIEAPMGMTLGEIIFDIGGGVPDGKKFKAVQTGGPLGGCIPPQHLNVKVDFDSLQEVGAVMGSGGMIVVDEDTCMVEFAKFFLTFAAAESCGKCIPCRAGGKRMLEIMTRICNGEGELSDLEMIKKLAAGMESASLCALGQLTPGPVMAALRYFEHEFTQHIVDKRCLAGSCQALTPARCLNACPAGVDVPAYLTRVAEGDFAEAVNIHIARNPFPGICGRVCPAFCEQRCRRADIDKPVAIRAVKRFMADHEAETWAYPKYSDTPEAEKIAVIGSGPAGLTAALRLAQSGYPVTVFEALPIPGGMMAVGIPEYRLPRAILNREIRAIQNVGVEIVCQQALGRDFTIDELMVNRGYKAVILAIGAHKSLNLNLPGENLPGVYQGVAFLRDTALGKALDLKGKRVAIIGGGNVAIDAARTAWRLGAAQIHVIYRRTRQEMPAYQEEIEAAADEGVQFHFLTAPIRIVGVEKTEALEVQHQALAEFDHSGRRRPIPIEGDTFTIPTDFVIPAIGQRPDIQPQSLGGININANATFAVNPGLSTSRSGVFAAGDAVSGPASVIEAVAQGNLAAQTVMRYLETGVADTDPIRPEPCLPETSWDPQAFGETPRIKPQLLDIRLRRHNFNEVELPWPEDQIRLECKRCLRCDAEWRQSHLKIGKTEG